MVDTLHSVLQRLTMPLVRKVRTWPHWILLLICIGAGLVFSGGISLKSKLALFGDGEWYAYDYKAQHLTADMSLKHDPGSHAAKLTTRVTFPLFVRVFRVNRNRLPLYFLFQSVVFVCLAYTTSYKYTQSKLAAWLGALFFSGTIPWSLIIWPATGFSDGMAWILSFSVLLLSQRWIALILPLGLAALWTDERAIFTLAACLLVKQWLLSPPHNTNKKEWIAWTAIPMCYWVSRVAAISIFNWNSASEGISFSNILPALSETFPFLFFTFALGWVLLAAFLFNYFTKHPLLSMALFGLTLGMIALSHVVHDVTRSLTYIFPIFLIPLLHSFVGQTQKAPSEPLSYSQTLTLIAVLACLFTPNIEVILSTNFHVRSFSGQLNLMAKDYLGLGDL